MTQAPGRGVRALGKAAAVTAVAALLALPSLRGWAMDAWGMAGLSLAPGFVPTRIEGRGHPLVLAGAGGYRAVVAAPPRRIVSATLSADEALLDLVDPGRVRAVTTSAALPGVSNVVEQARTVPGRVARSTDAESLLALGADLVLMDAYNSPSTQALVRDLGLPLYAFEKPERPQDVPGFIRTLGLLTGDAARAEAQAAGLERRMADVAARTRGLAHRPRVLYLPAPRYTTGAGTLVHHAIELAGGINAGAQDGITGYYRVEVERMLRLDPEVIVVGLWEEGPGDVQDHGAGGGGGGGGHRRRRGGRRMRADAAGVLDHPALQHLSAVREGRVYGLPARSLQTVSLHLANGLDELYELLHGPQDRPLDAPPGGEDRR